MAEIATTPLLQPAGSSSSSSSPTGGSGAAAVAAAAAAQEAAELRRENEALRTAGRQLAQRLDRLVQALGAVLDALPADSGCAPTLHAVAAELENLRDGGGLAPLPLMPLAIPKPRR